MIVDWDKYAPELCLLHEIGEDEYDITITCGPGGFIDRESASLSEAICRAAHYAKRGARVEWDRFIRISKISNGGRVKAIQDADGWTVYIYSSRADECLQVAHNCSFEYAAKMVFEAVSYGAVFDAVF